MEIVFRHGTATAAQIHADLEDAPTYTTVRGLLRVLVRKGQLTIRRAGARYVYSPVVEKRSTGQTLLSQLVRNFFGGSPAEAMAALLGSPEVELTHEELERLQSVIEAHETQARPE